MDIHIPSRGKKLARTGLKKDGKNGEMGGEGSENEQRRGNKKGSQTQDTER